MNYSTAVFLINKNLRAIMANYDPSQRADADYASIKKVMFKTLDPTIKKDDYVIVPTNTRHGMTVVKVTDTDVNVDFDDATPVNWVIGRVDRTEFEQITKQESEAIETLKRAEFTKRRKTMLEDLVADQEAIKALPLYVNGK